MVRKNVGARFSKGGRAGKAKSFVRRGKYARFIYGSGILSLEVSFLALILLILKFSPATIAWLGRVNYWVLVLVFLIFLIKPVHQLFQKHYF